MNTFERDIVREIEALKTQLRDISPTKRRVPIVASYGSADAESIPNNVATIINFEVGYRDTHSAVTTGASWRFTVPITGDYGIAAAIMYVSTATWAIGEAADLVLHINGTAYRTLDYNNRVNGASGAQFMQLSGSTTLYATAGQTVDLRTTQQSGAALALINNAQFNHVSIWKI